MSEKILVIDDDVDTLRLVGLMLQRQGYQISAASNGSQGLTKAFEERPDLILLDVMMPDMDGFEVTRRLRKNPARGPRILELHCADRRVVHRFRRHPHHRQGRGHAAQQHHHPKHTS